MQGKIINGYVLQRLISVGGMAEVWYAENEIGMRAAVKILLPKYCADNTVNSRFLNEAKVMSQLDHPNIRKVYSYGLIDDRPAIIMEYLDGVDLKTCLKQGQQFNEEDLRKWWNQLVSALNYTHQKGIVHRDIKPGNIFVTLDGNVKLLDFGIAKVKESISATQTGQKLGTLLYMSPEQVRDSKNVDYRTDSYSLAVTFLHLLTGRKPYDRDTTSDFEIMTNIVTLPLNLSGLPAAWQSFLAPYLEKDVDKRPDLRPFDSMATPFDADEGTVVGDWSQPSSNPQPSNYSQPMANPQPMWSSQPTPQPQPMPYMGSAPAPVQPPKRSKKGLWVGLGLAIAVLLAVGAGVFLLQSPDTKDFRACKSVNDYREYMDNYGTNGKHYQEANQIVEKFVADSIAQAKLEADKIEDAVYGKCVTIGDCVNYLQQYPNGRYVDSVQQKKVRLEAKAKEESDYKACTTIAACDKYIKTYPNGRYLAEVKAKKADLEQQAEEIAYQNCTTVSACNTYLKTYPNGRYVTEVKAKKAELEIKAYKGKFSVSSSQKVCFASGNLQYQPSTGKWREAQNPWEVIGEANSNISPNYSGWIDLFGWGTGNNPTKTSSDENDYAYFTDWGPKYKSGWRTLSRDEWKYVLDQRKTSSGIRYAKAQVNGMNGLILLPDNWSQSTFTLVQPNYSGANYSNNVITAATWNSILSPAGAVFLPAAGYRQEKTVGHVGSYGSCWSSSSNTSATARSVYFHESKCGTGETENRTYGRAVRLAHNVE